MFSDNALASSFPPKTAEVRDDRGSLRRRHRRAEAFTDLLQALRCERVRRIEASGDRELMLSVLKLVLLGERPTREKVSRRAAARANCGACAAQRPVDIARIESLLSFRE